MSGLGIKYDGACNYTCDILDLGTGPSGSLVIKRLSDNCNVSVIGVEGGDWFGDQAVITENRWNRIILGEDTPEYLWTGQTKNNPATGNRNFLYPQTGKLLGGSAGINNGNHYNISKAMAQQWENLLAPVWTVNGIVQAQKEIETFNGLSDPGVRGRYGPYQITQVPIYPQPPLVMAQKIVNALEQSLGLPHVLDYSNPDTPLGPTLTWQLFVDKSGKRSYPQTNVLNASVVKQQKGYMPGVGGRDVMIFLRAQVTALLFDNSDGGCLRVVGAIFLRDGITYSVTARIATFLALGYPSTAFMLSQGYGPRALLESRGIQCRVDNAFVGKNITNHVAIPITMSKPAADVGTDPTNDNFTCCCGGAYPDPSNKVPPGQRAVQVIFQDGLQPNGSIVPNPSVLAMTVFQLFPWSISTIEPAATPGSQNQPIVKTNYFTDPRDVQFWDDYLVKQFIPFYDKLHANEPNYVLVNPSRASLDDPVARKNYIVANLRQTHHGRGGLRMAPRNCAGVIDPYGRFYDLAGLYCVDTSILPFQPDGNNEKTVLMAAWKIIDFFLQCKYDIYHQYDWGKRKPSPRSKKTFVQLKDEWKAAEDKAKLIKIDVEKHIVDAPGSRSDFINKAIVNLDNVVSEVNKNSNPASGDEIKLEELGI